MADKMALTQLAGSWRLVSLGVTYADMKEWIELYYGQMWNTGHDTSPCKSDDRSVVP